jgi:hypothetical protein
MVSGRNQDEEHSNHSFCEPIPVLSIHNVVGMEKRDDGPLVLRLLTRMHGTPEVSLRSGKSPQPRSGAPHRLRLYGKPPGAARSRQRILATPLARVTACPRISGQSPLCGLSPYQLPPKKGTQNWFAESHTSTVNALGSTRKTNPPLS